MWNCSSRVEEKRRKRKEFFFFYREMVVCMLASWRHLYTTCQLACETWGKLQFQTSFKSTNIKTNDFAKNRCIAGGLCDLANFHSEFLRFNMPMKKFPMQGINLTHRSWWVIDRDLGRTDFQGEGKEFSEKRLHPPFFPHPDTARYHRLALGDFHAYSVLNGRMLIKKKKKVWAYRC